MKKIINILLVISVLLSGCSKKPNSDNTIPTENNEDVVEWKIEENVNGIDDPLLQRYIKDTVYSDLVSEVDEGFYIEEVSTVYISKEYLQEITYNSKENIFFGYTLSELDNQFEGKRYYFTLDENLKTTVKVMELYHDDTFNQIMKNVAVGAGVILVCVTVSSLAATAGAPAVSMIFAVSAETGAAAAVQGAFYKGISSAVITYAKTGEVDEAFQALFVGASEGFKYGAIMGCLAGGAAETLGLYSASLNGLTMDEAAIIQAEGYPLDVISEFNNMEQFNICKNAGLKPQMVNGHSALIRNNIDLEHKDEFGLTNLQRMLKGKPPLDNSGFEYELHHIGQNDDSTLAILTRAEHRLGDNYKIWHELGGPSKIDRPAFDKIREAFWKEMARLLMEGLV